MKNIHNITKYAFGMWEFDVKKITIKQILNISVQSKLKILFMT